MSHDWSRAVRDRPGGARLRVRVVPRSSSPGFDGVAEDAPGGPAVRLRLSSPPADGRANAEALRRVAAATGLAPRDVELVSGATSRLKTFSLSGLSASEAARRLAAADRGDG